MISGVILNQCLREKEETIKEETIIKSTPYPLTELELTPSTFFYVCDYYEIDSPKIVFAQAQLESGYFTSNIYKTYNNFLGLYNSKTQDYYSFTHWSDCLRAYKTSIQYKWNRDCSYYEFLQNLPYAEDPNYITKLKQLQR